MPLLEIRDLVKHFPVDRRRVVHAVDHVDLDVAEGEVLGLVGESGSGKSTLGKTVLGLHARDGGSVVFDGEALPARYDQRQFRRMASRMQMIFQDPYASLNPRMTVEELIGEGLRLTRAATGRSQIRDTVADWLTRVGLAPDHMARYPHEFSGGQRQRIGIARALVMSPRFVICDEPISALDVSVQAQVVKLLDDLKASMGLTLLFIAHDLSMVRHVSDRMAVMYLGMLAEVGPVDDVYFDPLHPYTRALVASNPAPDPAAERARARTPLQGEIGSPVDPAPGCRFAGRCPLAEPRCRAETPVLRPVAGGARLVACHRVD